jgi:CheY-like chemotaxis protein
MNSPYLRSPSTAVEPAVMAAGAVTVAPVDAAPPAPPRFTWSTAVSLTNPIVRRLNVARQSGGELGIASAPGQGTRVSLFLPVAAPGTSDVHRRQMSPDALEGSATILVVDDEPRMRRLVRRMLSELGYQVLEAENATAASRILGQDVSIDMLFTDVVMPGEMDGRALGSWAQQYRPGLKVLLTSGFPQQAGAEEALRSKPLPFLEKPYSKEQLQEAVRTLLFTQAS